MQEWLAFCLYDSCIEIKLTYHKGHIFKVHKVVLSSALIPKGFLYLLLSYFIYFILFLSMSHCVTIIYAQKKTTVPIWYLPLTINAHHMRHTWRIGHWYIEREIKIQREELVIKFRIMVLLVYIYGIWQNFLRPPFSVNYIKL